MADDRRALYMMRHPERRRESVARYNGKAEVRDRRATKRREFYVAHRESILREQRQDRAACPLCMGITFRRLYLKRHLLSRHKLSEAEAAACVPQKNLC